MRRTLAPQPHRLLPALVGGLLSLGVAVGCGGMEPEPGDGLDDDLRNSATASASPSPTSLGAVCMMIYDNPANYQDGAKLCTGTMLSSRRFLTAKHCTPQSTNAGTWGKLAVRCPYSNDPAKRYKIDETQIKAHPSFDVRVLPLTEPPSHTATIGVVEPPIRLVGQRDEVSAVGFRSGQSIEFLGTRRACSFCADHEGLLSMPGPVHGDSGGPIFYQRVLVGVMSSVADLPVLGHLARYVRMPAIHTWLAGTVPSAPPSSSGSPSNSGYTPPSSGYPPPSTPSSGTATSAPSAPAGNGPAAAPTTASWWNCQSSQYLGQQYWTCSGGDIYRCQGSQAYKIDCSYGCNSNATGTHDTCKASSSSTGSGSTNPPPSTSSVDCNLALGGPGLSCSPNYIAGATYCNAGGHNMYCCPYKQPVVSGACSPQNCDAVLGTGLHCSFGAAQGATYCKSGSIKWYCCPAGTKAMGGICR